MTDEKKRLDLAINVWDQHNNSDHECFADVRSDASCPSWYATLGDYLASIGLVRDKSQGRISGRDLSEPNFWSGNPGERIPVEESPVDKPMSVGEKRRAGILKPNPAVTYEATPEEDKETALERLSKVGSENEESVDVLMLTFLGNQFKHLNEYLGAISTVLVEMSERVERIEDALAEAKPKPIEVTFGQFYDEEAVKQAFKDTFLGDADDDDTGPVE